MSGQRHCARPRCQDCGLHPAICICQMRPTPAIPFQLIVIQHRREKHKPTNSVRPLRRVLPQTSLVYYAVRGEDFDDSQFRDPTRKYLLLFPDPPDPPDQAPSSPPRPALPKKLGPEHTLVVLDGTWAQCSRMRRRIHALEQMPTISLPFAGGSVWGIRHTLDPARVCTFEAVACAMRSYGYEQQGNEMLSFFQELAKRLQLMRGTAQVQETSLSKDSYRAYIEDVNTPRPASPTRAS